MQGINSLSTEECLTGSRFYREFFQTLVRYFILTLSFTLLQASGGILRNGWGQKNLRGILPLRLFRAYKSCGMKD